MSKSSWLLVVAAMLSGAAAAGPFAGDSQTLTGEFKWNGGGGGPLEARFTPTGDGQWEVSFYFSFRNRDHVYSGTAEGSLTDGELKGRVKNENRRRIFTFEGRMSDGSFRGTHAEIEGSRSRKTGTLTMER